MGMALEESTDGLEKLESNSIVAYIDPRLKLHLQQFGEIKVDFITNQMGQSGYRISFGEDPCASGNCSC